MTLQKDATQRLISPGVRQQTPQRVLAAAPVRRPSEERALRTATTITLPPPTPPGCPPTARDDTNSVTSRCSTISTFGCSNIYLPSLLPILVPLPETTGSFIRDCLSTASLISMPLNTYLGQRGRALQERRALLCSRKRSGNFIDQ